MRRLLVAFLLLLAASLARASGCDAVHVIPEAMREAEGVSPPLRVHLPDWLPVALRDERHRVRYRLDVSACADAHSPALWIFRAGAPYRVEDEAGRPLDQLNARARSLGPTFAAQEGIYNGRIPALFALAPGTREVTLELLTLPYLPAGLVRASVGPTNLLLPLEADSLEDVVAHADAASGVVLVLGLFALLLWLQRRSDQALLWVAMASGIWGLRGVVYFGHAVYLPPAVFEQFNPLGVLLASAALAASVLSLLGRLDRPRALVLAGITAACVLLLGAALVAGRGGLAARGLALLASFLMISGLIWEVLRRRHRLARWHLAVLVGAPAGLIGCAMHDVMVIWGVLGPEEPSYVFWGFVVLLVGFSAMSGQYVVLNLNRAERANEELERHIAGKTAELERSYARLRDQEREVARTQERERLLRDMHDGLGAQLMTALRGVERGTLAREQLAQSLQEGLDELRMLMDSADMGQYLPGALAAWRNRWDARLAAAGVALHWHIDESVDAAQLADDAVLQVLRILQEAATNIVKHAHARQMHLDARVRDGALAITIRDDGVGLPQAQLRAGSRGLKNMQHRAGHIGARLQVATRPEGGTQVVLEVPLAGGAGQATSPLRAASMAASAREEIPSLR